MSDLVTDTHSLIWYLEDSPRLGAKANKAFEACDRGEIIIYVPTICLVEMVYLQEKGRIPSSLRTQTEIELHSGTCYLKCEQM
jgi:PIN domain nuclease of toxin-antitoxin system